MADGKIYAIVIEFHWNYSSDSHFTISKLFLQFEWFFVLFSPLSISITIATYVIPVWIEIIELNELLQWDL